MIQDILVPAKRCTCDACKHEWTSFTPHLPTFCPECHTRQWNGIRPAKSHVHEIKLPAPRKAGRPQTAAPSSFGDEWGGAL